MEPFPPRPLPLGTYAAATFLSVLSGKPVQGRTRAGPATAAPGCRRAGSGSVPTRRGYADGVSRVVRSVEPADYPWVVDLIDRHRGEGMSAQERARRGFVQGHWDVAQLQRLSSGPGFLLAEVDGTRAGALLTSAPGAARRGPAGRTNELAQQALGAASFFLYGPVVVDDMFRGQGVLRALADELFARMTGRYDVAVAFIEAVNQASMAVHDRLGFRVFDSFAIGDREYHALSRDVAPRQG